jgi:hypothetical protein
MTSAQREKAIADLIRDVALLPGWYHHPQQGWFCPFGCHFRIAAHDPHAIKYGLTAPDHLPTCAIMAARELKQELRHEAADKDGAS